MGRADEVVVACFLSDCIRIFIVCSGYTTIYIYIKNLYQKSFPSPLPITKKT